MDPRQYDMSGHAAELFEAAIGLQPVTDDRGAGATALPTKPAMLAAEKSSIRSSRMRPGRRSADSSTAPMSSNLPMWLRP